MSTSLEKVAQLRDELSGPPSPDAEPAELALRTGIGFMAPQLTRFLPENPGDLDDLLERGAEWLLSLRSDDAPPMMVRLDTIKAELQPRDTAAWLAEHPGTSDDR